MQNQIQVQYKSRGEMETLTNRLLEDNIKVYYQTFGGNGDEYIASLNNALRLLGEHDIDTVYTDYHVVMGYKSKEITSYEVTSYEVKDGIKVLYCKEKK